MNMETKESPNKLIVTEPEAGQKFLRFLQRRTQQTTAMLHKWIRTGQTRINGKRSKPFALVEKGDEIRLPPFAMHLMENTPEEEQKQALFSSTSPPNLGKDLPVIYMNDSILALCKPSGMPVQLGTTLHDSVVTRLSKAFSGYSYTPAPAHRIDRYTSGVLLCGLTHKSQQQLHQWFSEEESPLCKEYLVWVQGSWQEKAKKVLLEDRLEKRKGENSKETMHTTEGHGLLARSHVEYLEERKLHTPQLPVIASLLRVKLLTGRKHQIRVQLSSRNYPIIGDPKYGGCYHSPMLLHAWQITLPDGVRVCSPPLWAEPFALSHDKYGQR